jgi:DNA-binding transcriptional regulator LsrR (DeoR family)
MKSIKESIIEFLNYEYYSQKNKKIELHMTKKELAEKLGIQRTSLSRELNKMKKDGLIDYNASSITICDFSIIRKF